MGNKPLSERKHWIVFGAQDVGDKSLLAYKDNRSGMYAVKILQNADNCGYEFGAKANITPEALESEIGGEYTTLFFTGNNGIKSLDVFIETLQKLRNLIARDAEEAVLSRLFPDNSTSEEEMKRAENVLKYVREKKASAPGKLTDIYIRDKVSGEIRKVGDNRHDMLTITDDDQLCYYNLQNGDGCRTGRNSYNSDSGYEFVPNEDAYGYNMDPRESPEQKKEILPDCGSTTHHLG